MPPAGRNAKNRKKGLLFVNKKKQKNFDFFDVPRTMPNGREAEQKVFGAFFQKRTAFLTLAGCCALLQLRAGTVSALAMIK
jgi:hypothetical protein